MKKAFLICCILALALIGLSYIPAGLWKCRKSPTGAHFWIIDEVMTCKFCKAERPIPEYKGYWWKGRDEEHRRPPLNLRAREHWGADESN